MVPAYAVVALGERREMIGALAVGGPQGMGEDRRAGEDRKLLHKARRALEQERRVFEQRGRHSH
ncbi:MAG: hypothetical protein ACR2NR_05885 [Solirubrobacteraceae bacterium]